MFEAFDKYRRPLAEASLPTTVLAFFASSSRHRLFAGLAQAFAYLRATLAATAAIRRFDQKSVTSAIWARGGTLPGAFWTAPKIMVSIQHTRQTGRRLTTLLTGLRIRVIMSTTAARRTLLRHHPYRFTDFGASNARCRRFATPAYGLLVKGKYRQPGMVATGRAESALEQARIAGTTKRTPFIDAMHFFTDAKAFVSKPPDWRCCLCHR